MGLEGTLQRVAQLRSAIGEQPSPAGAGRSDAGTGAMFASELGRARGGHMGVHGAGTGSGANIALPAMMDTVGMTPYLSQMPTQQVMPARVSAASLAAFAPAGAARSVGSVGPVHFPSGGTGNVGQRMLQMARGELGVREAPDGSNDSPRIATYRTATKGAAGIPGPWCAYFVSWLAKGAGAPIGAGGAGTGWVPSIESWGKQADKWVPASATPRQGDIVIFARAGGIGDHTGVVERVGRDGTIHTIEGNTSNRVARRTYASTATIRGYVRLD